MNMLSKAINSVPVQGRLNVIQAAIFNLNMRLVALARSKLAIVNRENALFALPEGGSAMDEEAVFQSSAGTFQFGKHIDGANALAERDRAATGGNSNEHEQGSAGVREEQGHDTPVDPAKQAEAFISLRDMLMLKYFDECNKARRKPLDQSFSAVINWMHDREFEPNQNEAQAVFAASKGRVSLEQALKAQKNRHEYERKRLAKIAEPLLSTMENFAGLDLSEALQTETPSLIDGDIVIDKLFDNLPALTRLGIVNVMWRRCKRLVESDFPSKRVPTQDFAADIALAIAAEDEFLEFGRSLFEAAEDDYRARQTSGLPNYDIVDQIELIKKSAAKEKARTLAKPQAAAA